MRRETLIILALLTSAAAHAQGNEGAACATSDDCGGLRCIDEQCHDPDALLRRAQTTRITSKGLFGDGHDYRLAVVTGDVCAAATVPVLILLGAALNNGASTFLAIASVLPTSLTGPIIHAVNGRAYPAVISFFGWASVPPTATFFGVLGALGDNFNDTSGIAVFVGIATAGAALMTGLDWYMARPITGEKKSSVEWTAGITPLRGGGIATVVGAF